MSLIARINQIINISRIKFESLVGFDIAKTNHNGIFLSFSGKIDLSAYFEKGA